ncbi:hypothetical protein WSM22_20300 [Cytophagales bacterium WSM2-2]|nr:hypothetical protein WSM22_20300 [Cytophagales bacterium WSM2-2]
MNIHFNNTLLADLMIQGYRHIILSRDEEVITMVPVKKPVSREELSLVNLAQLDLSDSSQIIALLNLHLLDEFTFLIDSKYFADQEEEELRLN